MEVIHSARLDDFIFNVVSKLESESNHKPRDGSNPQLPEIIVFCHGSWLSNFELTKKALTVSQIHALRRISIISDAKFDDVHEIIRKTWLSPAGVENAVWAFFDLLAECPNSALENASAVSRVLYMLNRSRSSRSPPRAIILNVPLSNPHESGEVDEFFVAPQIQKLASKWLDVS